MLRKRGGGRQENTGDEGSEQPPHDITNTLHNYFLPLSLLLLTFCLCVSGDFLSESHVYEDLQDMKSVKKFMETQLEDYNLTPGVVPMSLVLFRDAIEHSAFESTQHTHPLTLMHTFKRTIRCA